MNIAISNDKQIPLSTALKNVPKSATLAINEKSKQLQEEGKDIIRLGLGQSPFPVPEIMTQNLKAFASNKDYMTVQGYLPLREAIASYINQKEKLQLKADHVIIGPGSKELIFGLQMALDCDLILPSPSWVSYEPQAKLLGKKVHWLPCQADNDWKLTADTLEKHCQQQLGNRQLLLLNSPNNPSGACFTETELRALAEIAEKYDVFVLSDEIYSELHFQGQHQSIARYYPQGTIISNGISKWAGAGGWRLGFFIFPENLKPVLDLMIVLASETFTAVSAPIQMASISAFENSPEISDYIHACRNIMCAIGNNFYELLNLHQIKVVRPQGGFYCLADFSSYRQPLLSKGISDSMQLSEEILNNCGVAALPGNDFGIRQGLVMRMAYVDFNGNKLLPRVLNNLDLKLNSETEELRRLLSSAQLIGDWLQSL